METETTNTRFTCECHSCRSACRRKPGWFKPGEAEKVAEHLNISIEKLFDEYLAVDWYSEGEENYYPLSPAAKSNETGAMWPYNPSGRCVFLKDEKCSIHPVAPFECREYNHDDTHEEAQTRHGDVAKEWKDKKDYLTNLLGHPPYPPEPENFSDMFGFW